MCCDVLCLRWTGLRKFNRGTILRQFICLSIPCALGLFCGGRLVSKNGRLSTARSGYNDGTLPAVARPPPPHSHPSRRYEYAGVHAPSQSPLPISPPSSSTQLPRPSAALCGGTPSDFPETTPSNTSSVQPNLLRRRRRGRRLPLSPWSAATEAAAIHERARRKDGHVSGPPTVACHTSPN